MVMSSGTVSSTSPFGVRTAPSVLQLRSGCTRGTGPVSHTPGRISIGPATSITLAAGGFVIATDGVHAVVHLPAGADPRPEQPGAGVRRRQRLGIDRGELSPQRHQAGGVVVVVVAEDHQLDIGQIELHRLQVALDRVLVGAGVEQDLLAVDLDQRGEAPLAEALVGEHRRQDPDVELLHFVARGSGLGQRRRRGRDTPARTWSAQEELASREHTSRPPAVRLLRMTTARVLVVLGVATLAALHAPDGASAQAADPVAYTFRYDRPGDDIVVVEMTPPRALPDAGALVMPRAIPMGYGEQRYDAFVADVMTIDAGGVRSPATREEGPRWRLPAGTQRVDYRVDLRRLEREVRAASDQSRVRDGYLAVLGYSVFAFVDGFETRPATPARRGPGRLAGVQHTGPGGAGGDRQPRRPSRRLLRAGRRPDRDGPAGHGPPPHRRRRRRSTWRRIPRDRSTSIGSGGWPSRRTSASPPTSAPCRSRTTRCTRSC